MNYMKAVKYLLWICIAAIFSIYWHESFGWFIVRLGFTLPFCLLLEYIINRIFGKETIL